MTAEDATGIASATGFADAAGFRPPRPAPVVPPAPRDADLLSTLLRFVLPIETGPLADRLIARFGSFAAVLAAPERELRGVPGLGTHSIAAIRLVHGAALRIARAGVMHRPVLDEQARLRDYLTAVLAREKIEQFRILFLDARGRLLADEAQARGTVNHTPVYPREVVRRAIELQAAGFILVHNHPSGDPTPSRDDIAMTAQIREAADLLALRLHDHLIVGNGTWLSFSEAGLLGEPVRPSESRSDGDDDDGDDDDGDDDEGDDEVDD